MIQNSVKHNTKLLSFLLLLTVEEEGCRRYTVHVVARHFLKKRDLQGICKESSHVENRCLHASVIKSL